MMINMGVSDVMCWACREKMKLMSVGGVARIGK